MILRYIFIGLIRTLAKITGYFIVPFIFFIKDWLREKYPNVIWWFLNDNPPYDDNDIDAGDYGRFKHNFIGFYQQNAIRNSHWNLVLLLKPKNTNITEIKGNLEFHSVVWNRYLAGFRYSTYRAEGVKYFRLSWIKEFCGKYYTHGQFGTSDSRYVYKHKMGLISDVNKLWI
jgi:hypothetical protein